MNYITLEAVSKTYGEKTLLDKVDLRVNRGDKIALIAQNGSGKTTMMKIMSGLISPEGEHAKVLVSPGIRIGFLDQDPDLSANLTIMEALMQIDLPEINAWADHHRALLAGDAVALQKAVVKMDDHHAWDIESTMMQLLHQLHLDDTEKRIDKLSGGQKK